MINMLNNRGPKTDPRGTPHVRSFQELLSLLYPWRGGDSYEGVRGGFTIRFIQGCAPQGFDHQLNKVTRVRFSSDNYSREKCIMN